MNNNCRNCGAPLNKNKKCAKCGAINFEDPVEYSDFTTSKLNTKKILIAGGGAVFLIIIIIVLSIVFGKKKPVEVYDNYDTNYKSDKYKCEHSKSCDGNICIYEDESGGEEVIDCDANNKNWYSDQE